MKEGNNRISYIAVLFLMVFVMFGLSGCGSTGGMNDGEATVTPTETVGTVTLQVADVRLLSDGTSTTTVTAVVENSDGTQISRSVSVTFSTTAGTLSATSAKTSNGKATVILTSSTTIETATLKAASEGISADSVTVEFTAIPKDFSLLASQNTVNSDNSDSTTITAIVQDVNHVAIKGITVTFSVDGGQISAGSAETDENGKAQITFSAGGVDKTNRTVSITATIAGLETKTIPVQITGSEINLLTSTSSIDLDSGDVTTLTVSVADGGASAVYDTLVTATVIPGVPGDPNVKQGNVRLRLASDSTKMDTDGVLTGKTNINGKLEIEVVGSKVGQVTIQVEALGDTKTQAYTLASTAETFAIIDPASSPVAVSIGEGLTVTVRSPGKSPVQFSTTFGAWNGQSQVIEVPVGTDDTASAIFTASEAGTANIQVFDLGDSTHSTLDSIQVYISASPGTASQISLQASPTIVNPSKGDVVNTSEITATVKNASDQVVGNAVVAFSLSNTTGGGEYVSPVVVYTDKLGVAKTTFQSGSLPSSAEGVTVKAVVLSASGDVHDTVNIKIGGVSTSVVISRGTGIDVTDDETAYIQPMSVLVTDANGNPVSGAEVSLGVWPLQYATGYWTSEPCEAVHTGQFPNEDVNRNLILDGSEDDSDTDSDGDKIPNGNGDGKLTPPNSAAGAVRGTDTDSVTGTSVVTTGSDGLAAFNLVYLKNSAVWIQDEISATTKVAGSETRSTYTFWLPAKEDDACHLPHSPYGFGTTGSGSIVLSSDKTRLLANGKSEAVLSVIMTDGFGSLASVGTAVQFTVTSGGGGFPDKTTTVSIGTSGDASVTYIAPNGLSEGAIVKVQASSSGYDKSNVVELTLGQGQLLLTASPASLLTDGSTTSTITATVLDMDENPVSDEAVNFQVSDVAKGGFSESRVSTVSTTTGESGTSTVEFYPYTTSGTVTITATATGMAISKDVPVTLIGEQIGSITLDPADTDIPVGGFSTSIKATLTSTSGNPMPFGTPVSFLTTKGTLSPSGSLQVNNTTGTVTVTLKSDTTPGAAIVTCSSSGVSQSTSVNFTSEGTTETVATMNLVAADPSIPATSGSSTNVTATVKDSKGAAVAGAEISFTVSSNAKLFPGTSTVVADNTGVATVQLIAQGTSGDAEVTATAGTVSKRVVVKLTTSVGSIEVEPADESISAKAGSSTTITATVKDIAGKAVPAGTEVTFATTLGKISPQATVITPDASGKVVVSLVAEGAAGQASITASSGGVSNNTSVTFTASPSGAAVGEEFGLRFLGWDAESNNICANVGDVFGNPVSDGTLVYFKTYNTGGWIEPASRTTVSGEACVMLHYDPLSNTAPVNDVISVTAETQGGLTTHITSIAVINESGNPFNHIVYAGTDGSGIYKSTNSGQTWQTVSRSTSVAGQNWIDPYVNDIVIDPYNSNIVYAATGYLGKGNIFRSLDGGQNWNSNNSFETNGIYEIDFAITTILIDDDKTINPETEAPYVWIGTDGNGLGTLLFEDYHSTPQVVNKGTKLSPEYWENSRFQYVHDIVKVPGTHRATAVLYAATSIGVYKSSNGGNTWTKLDKSPFTGYYTNTLEVHPSSSGADNDVVYAGTRDGSVWVSTDSGQNWTQYINGFAQIDNNGRYIRDLLVDEKNDRLYAVTYYKTEQMDYAVGNIYSHELESNGSMETGEWEPAGTGLPTHSGGTVARYALASLPDTNGNAANPTGLLTGGDQLSLYRAAADGLQTGTPAWSESDSGFTNIIMARTAVAVPVPAKSISFSSTMGNTHEFYCSGGKVEFTMSHDGEDLFSVGLINLSDPDDISILLISKEGKVTDEVSTTYLNMGNYQFVVRADGNWTVNVKGNVN